MIQLEDKEEAKWKQAPEVGDHIQLPLAAANQSKGPLVNCKASIERDPVWWLKASIERDPA